MGILIRTLVCILLFSGVAVADTHVATSTALADVQTAIDASETDDTVTIPAGTGTVTWGDLGAHLDINKSIVLQGPGTGLLNITLSDTGGTYTSAVIMITYANVTVKDFTVTGTAGTTTVSAFSASGESFRITNIVFVGTPGCTGYFLYASSYGLVDNCVITGGAGNQELIFIRGPADSWQTANSIGESGNVFVENNTFAGSGYVCDANSNSRMVLRYNTINAVNKIDGHGKCTNSPNRSVRNMEIYNNLWTGSSSNLVAMEIRGGTARIFNNVSNNALNNSYILLRDYATFSTSCYGYTPACCCPGDYPCDDQIGVGIDLKSAASEPVYLWNNIKNGSAWTVDPDSGINFTTCSAADKCGESYTSITQIQADRDYFVSTAKPEAIAAYSPYTCPHPLTGLTGSCDSSVAGTTGYNVTLSSTSTFGAFTGTMR